MIRKMIDKLKYKLRAKENQRFIVEWDYLGDDDWTPAFVDAEDYGGYYDEEIGEFVFTRANAEWFYFYRSVKQVSSTPYRIRRVY